MAFALPSRAIVARDTFELQMKRRRWLAGFALVMTIEQALVAYDFLQIGASATAEPQGDIWRQVTFLAICGILLLAPANARPPMRIPVSVVVLLGYCLVTVLWAIDPVIALRRLAFASMVIWILVRSIGDLGAVRTLNLIRATLLALLVLNYIFVLFTPYGVHTATLDEGESVIGDWRGIMQNKNLAGSGCALTVLLFSFDRDRLPTWLCGGVVAAALFFLAMAQSKTSIGVLAIAAAAGAIMRLYNPRHRSLVLPVALIALVGVLQLIEMYSGVIANMIDDPSALTGRGAIWPLLLEYASDHLWTGAGYGSFWQIGDASPIWTLTSGWVASVAAHGHNGYLDLLVTIGLPGLVLAIAVLFVWPALRLLYSTNISRARRALLTSLMVFAAGHNLTESTLLAGVSPSYVFLMIAIILIHRLSNQSMGAHQMLRSRMMKVASGVQLSRLRGRLIGADAAGIRLARRKLMRENRAPTDGSAA
jgi:O-antigen ligase